MTRFLSLPFFLSFSLIMFSAGSLSASGRAPGASRILRNQKPVSGSYIVVLKDGVPLEGTLNSFLATHPISLSRRNSEPSIFRNAFRGFSGTMSEAVAETLANDPRVLIVEENAYITPSAVQYFTEQYPYFHLDRIDQSNVITPNARSYGYTTTGAGSTIYVVDDGVLASHWEFDDDDDAATPATRVQAGVKFAADNFPADNPCGGQSGVGHGTAVASIAAGRFTGVAKGATIVPVKVITCDMNGTLEWMAWGLDWIVSPENPYPKTRAVVNISGYFQTSHSQISSLEHAINNVLAAHITVVTSANNQANSSCVTSPARMAYNNTGFPTGSANRVISVGGADEQDRLWRCANFANECNGIDVGSNTGPCVDLYSQAHNLRLAAVVAFEPTFYRSNRTTTSGTSFASPAVAGVVARILQNNPNMSPFYVWDAILTRTTLLPSDFDGDGVSNNNRHIYLNPSE